MERNPAANNYAYFKEPVNYPTNTAYGEIFQPTYPYEDEVKERRYQQQTSMHYHQNYPKPPDTTYKPEKTQSSIKSYSNYNFPNYKDAGQYSSYYDQYKFNMSLPAINNYSKTKDGYPHNYSTGMFPDSKASSAFCEEANLTAKGSLMKPPPTNPQISQYMYTNCYGYPAASYPNQNYCSYAQSCNDEARILWDDYQTNRRLLSSYVPAPPPPPPPPPQSNCRLKDNYNSEYYGSTASYPYHAESLRSREKLLYSMNSHTTPSENLYNSRPIWPVGLQYQSMPQNMMMNSYDRLNYINDAQNYDYCSQRQDTTGFHPAYVKPTLVNSQQKHIRPATMPTDYYNTQRYYLCNEQLNTELQDAYSQQCLRDTRHTAAYNQQVEAAANARTSMMPVANEMASKDPVYNQITVDNAYYNQNNQGSLNLSSYTDSSKSAVNKGQNLREFLSSWNEDEDDGIDRMDGNESQVYLQQANIEVENAPIENHLQFKGSFNTRPKIHVGITVDSNVANNQYINLPDIIIDIEKSKESDHISSHIETQNAGNEKLVFLEAMDVPVATDLSQYSNINLDENVVEQFKNCPITTEQTANLVHELDLSMETVENIEKIVLCSDDIAMAEEVEKQELPKIVTPNKTKRYKRISKPKTLKRMIRKTRTIRQIDKTKERRLVRIKKVWKKIKKERSSMAKKTKTIAAAPIINNSLEHSNNNGHSLHNPKTLKYLCVNSFNSEMGREYFKKSYCIEKERKLREKFERKSFVPKLSVLCEYALNNFYEEKNILLLNLDELDSNLYFVECDINENLISTQNDSIESDFIELLIDDDDDDDDDDNDETIGSTTDPNQSLNSNNNTLDNFNEICLTSDENSRDFSSLHHEEIVPDNLHAFENEKLLKYLQSKYIQNHNYLKIFIIDKICKKYRKYILKRRRQKQQETTKKFLLSKIKEKLIKKKKHLKIGSC